MNFSTAKQKYSFARGHRFPIQRQPIYDISYELPSTFSKRAPSFGIGNRFQELQTSCNFKIFSFNLVENPSPGTYRQYSDFEQSELRRTKAYTFGISREAYEKVYNPSLRISTDKSLPGPGTYTLLSSIGRESRKFSIQGRTPYIRDTTSINVKQGVPGPGNYEPKVGIDKVGRYTLSNFKNSKAATFSPGTRFPNQPEVLTMSLPGPGYYEPHDQLNGSYILSTIRNQGVRKFGTSKRMHYRTPSLQTPGPGQYRPPSDFGYVESFKHSPRQMGSQASPRLISQQNLTRNHQGKQDSLITKYTREEINLESKDHILPKNYALESGQKSHNSSQHSHQKELTEDEDYSSQDLDKVSQSSDNHEFDQIQNHLKILENEEEKEESEDSENSDINDNLDYDSDGRPVALQELFDDMKKNLGEQQSEQLKLLYELLSNQVKFCLQGNSKSENEEVEAQLSEKEKQLKKQAENIVDPNVLAALLRSQSQLILNVYESKENSQQVNEQEFAVKLRLKAKNKKTKQYVEKIEKNPLIMVNTKSTKDLNLIFDYLCDKQFSINKDQLILFNNQKQSFRYGSNLKVQNILASTSHPDSEGQCQVENLTYEIVQQKQQINEDPEDMSNEELMELLTEFMSLLLLKKKRKHFEQQNFDDLASLPHPNNLLRKHKRALKREQKMQQKQQNQKDFQLLSEPNSIENYLLSSENQQFYTPSKQIPIVPPIEKSPLSFNNIKQKEQPLGEKQGQVKEQDLVASQQFYYQQEYFETVPYFHSLLKNKRT